MLQARSRVCLTQEKTEISMKVNIYNIIISIFRMGDIWFKINPNVLNIILQIFVKRNQTRDDTG